MEDRPFFGICLGLQVLFESSEEGNLPGLGLFEGRAMRFCLDANYKIPHMGWNQVAFSQPESTLLDGIDPSADQFYFVHSYYAQPIDTNHVVGTTDYGDKTFCSVVARENLFATQFHLEKSGELGLKLLGAFKHWDATC